MVPGGYAWWYVDALSDDGRHAITLIAFVGSVFSPYYAWNRRHGGADAVEHCALNVALYGERANRWAMTERGRDDVAREPATLVVGTSAVLWAGDVLEIRIDEVTVPWPSRLRGVVRVYPSAVTSHVFALDAGAQHRWRPIAPFARVEVEFARPGLRWSGDGYFDSNIGDEPLEHGFSRWDWSRAAHRDCAAVLYDATPRDGAPLSLALRFDRRGELDLLAAPPPARLPNTAWALRRTTRADDGHARVRTTLENAPFYARSVVDSQLFGVRAASVHESLDLDRFASPVVQWMLPFRMPRVTGVGPRLR